MKIHAENEAWRLVLHPFCFFKKLYMRWKQLICSLVSIYTDSPQLSYNKNELYKTLDYWSRDMLNFDFLEKGLGINSPPHLVFDFSRKMFHIIFCWLTKFQCLIAFTFWDTGQYECSNCLFPSWWHHKFWISIFLIKVFYYLTKNSRQKFKYLENQESF